MNEKPQQAQSVLADLPTLLPDLESVYKDIHSHPELSMQENGQQALPPTASGRRVMR